MEILDAVTSFEQSGDESPAERRDVFTSEETSEWSESPNELSNMTLSNISDNEKSEEGSDEQIKISDIQPLDLALSPIEEHNREDGKTD